MIQTSHHKGSILLLDDEKNIVTVLKAMLEKQGFVVEGFSSPKEALHCLEERDFHVAITDLRMPEMDGIEFLQKAVQLRPRLPVLVITAFGTVATAVDAIRKGAFDYIMKPFEQSEIICAVDKALNVRKLSHLEVKAGSGEDLSSIPVLFQGKCMRPILELAVRYAASSSVISITGALGTGKELLLDYIYHHSPRKGKSLLRMNCVAVPVSSLDKELFGSQEKVGRIEMAQEGTLFLDEIGKIPQSTQVKLLHLLETGQVENEETGVRSSVDIHLIVANPGSLQKEVKDGSFREDLFYSLNVAPISLPSLEERLEDMEDIVLYFINRLNKKLLKSVRGIELDCLSYLKSRKWVGNFRELETLLERMMLLVDEKRKLKKEDIPGDLLSSSNAVFNPGSFRSIIKDKTNSLEKAMIQEALRHGDKNITKTAKLLGISRRSLQMKIKEFEIHL